jgi:uncharacterized protein YndB with AHSA1/START domain
MEIGFMRNVAFLATGIFALVPAVAAAAVADSSASGFTVKISVTIQAAPDEVYRRLVHNVGDWWNSDHTFSGDAHNLSIEEKASGCFCEKLPKGGGVRHMEVINFVPGKTLVLTGGLGPLQSIAASGNLSFQLSAAPGGTKLDVTYAMFGYLPAGMNTFAGPVDGVLTEQITRLKNYTEHGNPAPK